ncbi:hypothetical protein Dimus_022050 [Dionaea muscipula]
MPTSIIHPFSNRASFGSCTIAPWYVASVMCFPNGEKTCLKMNSLIVYKRLEVLMERILVWFIVSSKDCTGLLVEINNKAEHNCFS